MKQIWKYKLRVVDQQNINIPVGSDFLCVQLQDNNPCLWVSCDPNAEFEQVLIIILGTGEPFDPDKAGKYIGTFQLFNGLVFHVFGGV